MHYKTTGSAILEPRHSARGSCGTALASRPGLATLRNAAPSLPRAQSAALTARAVALVESPLPRLRSPACPHISPRLVELTSAFALVVAGGL